MITYQSMFLASHKRGANLKKQSMSELWHFHCKTS